MAGGGSTNSDDSDSQDMRTMSTENADPTYVPRTDEIHLYSDLDLDAISAIEKQLEAARKSDRPATRLLSDVDAVTELTSQHDALVAEARERATLIVLQQLPRKEWKALVKAHPPREGNLTDAKAGVNEESLMEVLVPLSVKQPTFSSDTARDRFLDAIDDIRYEKLYISAYFLNRGLRADPKALQG